MEDFERFHSIRFYYRILTANCLLCFNFQRNGTSERLLSRRWRRADMIWAEFC